MILVYQMGKVASRSWYEAIRALVPDPSQVAHIHHLAGPPRQRLARVLELPAPRQTIANRIMPREQLRKGDELLRQLDACRRRGETIRIVSGVREPVARSISLLMFMADFYGHVSRPLAPRQGGGVAELSRALEECWRSVWDAEEPQTSFEWVARNAVGLYRTWFHEELQAMFGVDVLQHPLPPERFQRLSAPGVDVLVYRVEDIRAGGAAPIGLIPAAADMLRIPLRELPSSNTSEGRRSFPVYAQLSDSFRLPAALLDRIYSDPCVRHYYTEGERQAFRTRWQAREGRVHDRPA